MLNTIFVPIHVKLPIIDVFMITFMNLGPASSVDFLSITLTKYIGQRFMICRLHVVISVFIACQGVALAAKESEVRELMAKLHQTELNNTLQQDLLKHMMADRVDIEVDNLMISQMDGKMEETG